MCPGFPRALTSIQDEELLEETTHGILFHKKFLFGTSPGAKPVFRKIVLDVCVVIPILRRAVGYLKWHRDMLNKFLSEKA